MHLLQFLEICIGELPLWPTYILELLFLKEFSPENILKVAAYFCGHGVPLRMASRAYSICNNNSTHLVPFVMGGYYSTWFTCKVSIHQALYYNVREGRILWLNGYNHSQFETVDPSEKGDLFYMDCRTVSQSKALDMETFQLTIQWIREEEAFGIMDI